MAYCVKLDLWMDMDLWKLSFSNTPKYSDYVFKKRILMEQIETKLDQGLDRSISAVIGWVKVYLQYEQKKTDYKPETDVDTISSAVRYIFRR